MSNRYKVFATHIFKCDMPPKKKVVSKKKESVQPLVDEPVEQENEEHVLLHLPIHSERLTELTFSDTILEYNPVMYEPSPYDPTNQFISENDILDTMSSTTHPNEDNENTYHQSQMNTNENADRKVMQKCFWCCHDVGHEVFGMPIRYDALNKNFAVYGTFCSLECACAFNFSQHLGSDRAWEIHSWIQMLGKRFGYKEAIRPAPSRYLLKLFNGPLTIEEFRKVHQSQSRTMVLNIPPLISVPSQMEMINTSFLGTNTASTEKKKRTRTIDTKMKLLVQTEPDPTGETI